MFQLESPSHRLTASAIRQWLRITGLGCLLLVIQASIPWIFSPGGRPFLDELPLLIRLWSGSLVLLLVLSAIWVIFAAGHSHQTEIGLYSDCIASPVFGKVRAVPVMDVDVDRSLIPGRWERFFGWWSLRDAQGRSLARFPIRLYRRQDVETFFKAIEAKQSASGL